MIQLQHTPKTTETTETYNYNIGWGDRETGAGNAMAAGSEDDVSNMWGRTPVLAEGSHLGGVEEGERASVGEGGAACQTTRGGQGREYGWEWRIQAPG